MSTVTPPQIEAYLYADLKGLNAIQLSENGADFYTLTLTTTAPVQDALAEWQSLANAHGSLSGTYAFAWTGDRIRFARTDGAPDNFWLNLPRSVHDALGFSSQAYSGAASYDGESPPTYISLPSGIDYDAPAAVEDVLAREGRDGRPVVYVHQHGQIVRLTVYGGAQAVAAIEAQAPRVRAWPPKASGAYTLANLRGYFDLDIVELTDIRSLDAAGDVVEVTILGAIPGGA